MSWLLRELKYIDGKDANKETAEFDLHFEKVYRWMASSMTEKDSFITCIWKLSRRYLIQKPDFINVSKTLMEEVVRPSDQGQIPQDGDDISVIDEDYQALSTKEESDLELLMSECQAAISNAESFAEQLSKQLSVLDGANIHSIMGSEDQVLNLMRLLDDGIQQAEHIENRLNCYDSTLQNVKEQMEVMKDKDTLMTIRNKNHQQLLEELDNLITRLDLDDQSIKNLLDGDLSKPGGIYDCTQAAHALQRCVNADIHPALLKMGAVEEQQKRFSKLTASFAKSLARHLNNLFIHQGNEIGETLSRYAGDLKLPPHHSSHRDLTPYAELMLWLKTSDRRSFDELTKVYTNNLSKLYTKEIQDFLELARQLLLGKGDKTRLDTGSDLLNIAKVSGSTNSLGRPLESRGRSPSMQSVDSVSISHHGSDSDLAVRQLFDQVLDKVLSEMEPVCLAEQDFCMRFFHLMSDTADFKEQIQSNDDSANSDIWMPRKPALTVEEYFVENLGAGLYRRRASVQMRQLNEEVRQMMSELFPSLERDLESFIVVADKLDGFYSMYMLVRMGQHVINAQDTGSFLSVTFASSLVKIKRNFDKFINNQMRSIEETKVSKKNKCGIISFVRSFEDFANQAEVIFRSRRTDLDKAYMKLVNCIFSQIQRVAAEHQKTPREVIMMENYHRLFSILSHLKNSCLENDRKAAKTKYQECLAAYTTTMLGRPLEKLHTFFEGVEGRVASGVKPEEVGFQLAFSKQELRKVIKEYPIKEVKKGLEHMYKKVEKHLSEEENLLQVVWLSSQDEFIKQCEHYKYLINKCYPDSGICLEFSIDDVLKYFSDIAQSH
ncbi:hypothetical protein ScPMuIL_010571 [Solemya velum]